MQVAKRSESLQAGGRELGELASPAFVKVVVGRSAGGVEFGELASGSAAAVAQPGASSPLLLRTVTVLVGAPPV